MPPEAPRVSVPVLPNVTALVIVPPVPVSETLFTVFSIVKVPAVTAPVKLAVPPMLLKVKAPVPLNEVPVTSAPITPAPVLNTRS